tara:strand:+ start:693 stop:893 length:201 start_codon:yes stop_codon:yes gene_type:complete
MATKKAYKTSMDKMSDLKKTYERCTRRGTKATKQKGIRISYKMMNKAFIALCIVSLITLGYLHLFI